MEPDERRNDVPELLVPFDGTRAAEKVLRRACRVARRDAALLTVMCVVLVPHGGDDNGAPDDSALAATVRAQQVCRDEGCTASFELSHARNLAEAVVAEAERSHAALICLSLSESERGGSALMSDTVQHVLASAPCPVLLDDPTTASLPINLGLSGAS